MIKEGRKPIKDNPMPRIQYSEHTLKIRKKAALEDFLRL